MAKKTPKIVKQVWRNKPRGVDYSYQKNVSYSQVSLYNQCPHRWKLRYKDKKKMFTQSIYTVFGTALHKVIQDYLDVLYNDTVKKSEEINFEFRFRKEFTEEYKKQFKKNNNQHFSSADEMREFFEDGLEALQALRKKRKKFFPRKKAHLVGCELPIVLPPHYNKQNLLFTAYLDVVIYDEILDQFLIIDLKTSTRGWKDYMKKDEEKTNQIVLYKKFFSEQYGIPLKKIKVEYIILKRKIWEDSPYPISRIQQFDPPSGKIKLNRASSSLDKFLDECFDTKSQIKEQDYPTNPSKWNCRFCEFLNSEFCKDGISS